MKEILKKKWVFTLYEHDEQKLLSVVCGTVGLFERKLFLTYDEWRKAQTDEAFLDKLSQSVRDNPEKFSTRYIKQ